MDFRGRAETGFPGVCETEQDSPLRKVSVCQYVIKEGAKVFSVKQGGTAGIILLSRQLLLWGQDFFVPKEDLSEAEKSNKFDFS